MLYLKELLELSFMTLLVPTFTPDLALAADASAEFNKTHLNPSPGLRRCLEARPSAQLSMSLSQCRGRSPSLLARNHS